MGSRAGCLCIVGIALLGVCAVALVVVGVSVADPYVRTAHFSKEPRKCTVESVDHVGPVSCDCGDDEHDCTSSYPCVRIIVSYTARSRSETVVNATLYHHPYIYAGLVKHQCSTRFCSARQPENDLTIKKFVQRYGNVGRILQCYPAMKDNPEALLSLIPQWHVLLGMLLPASVFIVIAIAFLVYLRK